VGLTSKRKAFVQAYCGEAAGNASEAARIAGYRSPGVEGCRLLKDARVQAEVRKHAARKEREDIATSDERQMLYTKIMRSEGVEPRDRIKAAETLGKMHGDFLPERLEVSGPGGGDQVVRLEVTLADAKREAARLPPKGE
jgi:phage terminase small subunit